MKVLILGFGVTGRAVTDYFLAKGADVMCVDERGPFQHPGVTFLDAPCKDFDLAVKSPGFRLDHPWVMQTGAIGEVELACRLLKERGKRLYGITGSNGKTTTTLATAHVLEDALAVGNVGVPLISVVEAPQRTLVIELSSFQLEELSMPLLDAGVILNITPNHLDRYPSLDAYAQAKLRLHECLKPDGKLFVHESVLRTYDLHFAPISLTSFKEKVKSVISLDKRCVAEHDLDNFAAAYALATCEGLSAEHFSRRLTTFDKPPHRLEYVATVCGVTYIDDSKATSVDAVRCALLSLPPGIIWIAGGVDKGGAFRSLKKACEGRVKKIVVIGEAAPRITAELSDVVPVARAQGLEQAVAMAKRDATEGETVLLSPGCSSYDQFRDYVQRGERFKQFVMGENS